jgi:hypothetical protein
MPAILYSYDLAKNDYSLSGHFFGAYEYDLHIDGYQANHSVKIITFSNTETFGA